MNSLKLKIIGVFILGIGVLTLVLSANAWKSSLTLKSFKIDGNRMVGTNEILQLTQIPYGTLLYQVDLMAIQRNVTGHYYIKDALVERNLPSTIHIVVVERIPIAMVNQHETLYLDEDGFVLPRTISKKLFDLPIISGIPANESMVVGTTVTKPDVKEALLLLGTLKVVNRPMYHYISEVQVRDGGDIVLYSADGGVPILFGRGELPDKIVRLETFWNEIVRVRGPQYLQYVDLRYQDQIVVRWTSGSTDEKTRGL